MHCYAKQPLYAARQRWSRRQVVAKRQQNSRSCEPAGAHMRLHTCKRKRHCRNARPGVHVVSLWFGRCLSAWLCYMLQAQLRRSQPQTYMHDAVTSR